MAAFHYEFSSQSIQENFALKQGIQFNYKSNFTFLACLLLEIVQLNFFLDWSFSNA